MAETPAGPTVFYRSLRQLGSGLFSAVQERFELLCIELQEEKFKIFHAFILINAAIVTGLLAMVFVSFTVVFAVHPGAPRLIAMCCLSVVYLGAFGGIVLALRRNLKGQEHVLRETRRELAFDSECIPPRS